MADEQKPHAQDLSGILEAFLLEMEAGRAPDAQAWIARYPELAAELAPCLEALETMAAPLAKPEALAPSIPPALTRLEDFRVIRPLGSGGMGSVYLAMATTSSHGTKAGDLVALKVLHGHLLDRPGFFRRFLREAQLGRLVQHANVVRTLDVDAIRTEEETLHFLVMEYVEGTTLRQLLDEMRTVPEGLLREIARQIAAGLAAIHEAGIVHRDLKPGNVLVTPDYRVRIMDLGVARPTEASQVLTREGEFAGSVPYAAPEQFETAEVGLSADLYALGVLLYELATGVNPFRRDHAVATMQAHLQHIAPPASEVNSTVSPFLSLMLTTLLAKDPAGRFDSAHQVLDVLERGEEASWWTAREAGLVEASRGRPAIPVPCATTLHGRQSELAVLGRAWQEAKAGRGSVVFLEGEAGIGKTRIADAFLRTIESDANLLYGSYPPSGGAGGLSDAITTRFGRARLAEALRPFLPSTSSLAPAFAAVIRHQALPPGAEPLRGDALHAVTTELMRTLAAEQPLVWVIDDLHFADQESRKTVLAMARAVEGHRVLLLISARTGTVDDDLVHLGRTPGFRRLALGRLSARQVMELLREAFRSDALADKLGGKIAYKSDGIPFFVCEIVRALKEGHFIEEQATGSWAATRVVSEIEVPSAVRDLIAARLGDLDEQDRNLLDVAAVQGHVFDADLVARVWQLRPLVVLSRLAALERRTGIVRASGRRYRFDHHQIQEVLYEDLPPALKEGYHAALADTFAEREHLTELSPEELEPDATTFLATHHLKGNRPELAAPYLESALSIHQSNYNSESALDLAEHALAVPALGAGSRRVDLLVWRSALLEKLGRAGDAVAVAEEALAGAEAKADPALLASALNRRGAALQAVGRFEQSVESLERAIVAARDARELARESEGCRVLGTTLQAMGRAPEARRHLERALEIARKQGNVGAEASTLVALGNVHFDIGAFDDAKAAYERALECARAGGFRDYEGTALGNLGNLHGRLGDFLQLKSCNEERLVIARETGNRIGEAAAIGNLGIAHHILGDYPRALEFSERQLALARELANPHWEAAAHHNLGNLLLVMGQAKEAVRAQQRALDMAQELGARQLEPFAQIGLAQALREHGDLPRALAHAEHGLATRRELGIADGVVDALLTVGRIHQELGDEVAAIAALKEAREKAQELGMTAFVVLAAARLATLPGGNRAAARLLLTEHEAMLEAPQREEARALLYPDSPDQAEERS